MRQSIFSYKNNVNEYFYTEHRNAAKMITTITYCRNVIAGLCTNSSYTQKANNHPYWHTHTQTTHADANVYPYKQVHIDIHHCALPLLL